MVALLMIPDSIRLRRGKSRSLNAGNRDYRFELANCSVSLLIEFENCEDPLDWTRGVHGIRISFPHPGSPLRRRFSATYLPDVCTDQGWTKEECLESLMRKAGYDPSVNRGSKGNGGWRSVKGLKVERYRALKGRIMHGEYLEAVREFGKLN
jgi:AMME syndrome candidate gene 1 protein